MGIKGLSTYMNTKGKKYEKKVFISNTIVVIDGSNLMFYLYLTSEELLKNSHHIFGGDAAAYTQCVRLYFQKLKCCCIYPIVIFDGAYEVVKQNEKLRRFADSLRRNVRESGQPGKTYTPIYLRDVLIAVLQEQQVDYFQTEFEADDTIALVSKQLGNCPIFSNDSDFFMSVNSIVVNFSNASVKKQQVPTGRQTKHDYTNLGFQSPCTHYMAGKAIDMKALTKKELQLNEARLLPLATVVIGNDFVSKFVFLSFLNKASNSDDPTYDRLEQLLKWFSRQRNYEFARETLLEHCKEEARHQMRQLIDKIVSNYMGEGGDVGTWNLIKNSPRIRDLLQSGIEGVTSGVEVTDPGEDELAKEMEQLKIKIKDRQEGSTFQRKPDDADQEPLEDLDFDAINNYSRPKVPEWFLKSLLNCDFPFVISTILYNRRVYLMPQVEAIALPSSHAISVQIIQAIAGLLYGPGEVQLVSRDRFSPAKINVPCSTSLLEFYSLKCIIENDIDIKICWNSERRLNLLLESLSLTNADKMFIHEWPPYLKIWITAILYFIRKMKKYATEKSLVANTAIATAVSVVLCCLSSFTFAPVQSRGKNDFFDETIRINGLLQLQKRDPQLVKMFNAYAVVPTTVNKKFYNTYDIEQVFVFSQFQSVLYFTNALNSILREPFRPPKFSLLNCYMIYNICLETQSKFDGLVLNFMKAKLGYESPLVAVMSKLMATAVQGTAVVPNSEYNLQSRKFKSKKLKPLAEDSPANQNRYLLFALEDEASLAQVEDEAKAAIIEDQAVRDKWEGEDEVVRKERVKEHWDDESVCTNPTVQESQDTEVKSKKQLKKARQKLQKEQKAAEERQDGQRKTENMKTDPMGELRAKFASRMNQLQNRSGFSSYVEDLIEDLCRFLPSRRLCRIRSRIELIQEKQHKAKLQAAKVAAKTHVRLRRKSSNLSDDLEALEYSEKDLKALKMDI